MPILKQLFSSNDETIEQTDIVMLLTPHIIRTHEITEADLQPIYIGSQQNLGLGGPPPLIALPRRPAGRRRRRRRCRRRRSAVASGRGAAGSASRRVSRLPAGRDRSAGNDAGAGNRRRSAAAQPPPAPQPQPQPPPPAAPAQPPPAHAAAAAAADGRRAHGAAPSRSRRRVSERRRCIIVAAGPTFRVGGGPYTVPISIANVSRLSTVTLTLTYDPALLRVRACRRAASCARAARTRRSRSRSRRDRVDITIARAADATGASGTGLLAAVLFDAVAPGRVTLTLSGTGTGPGGTPMGAAVPPRGRDGATVAKSEICNLRLRIVN